MITSLKDKEVLSTNGYAVLPFDQTPGAPIEVPKVAAKVPEVPSAKIEAEMPEAKMRKP